MDFFHNWIIPPEVSNPELYLVMALAALAIMSVSKGGFGGAAGMVSVPLLIQAAPVKFVLGLWLPVLVVCDVATIRHYPQEWNPRAFARLLPGTLLGIGLVTLLLRGAPAAESLEGKRLEAWLKLAVALVSVAFLLLKANPASDGHGDGWKPTWPVSLPVGLLAGITTACAHAAGPIVMMFLLPQKMEPRVFVGTCGRFYFLVNLIKVPCLIFAGCMTLATLKYGVWMMLLGPLGVALGARLNRRVNAMWFTRLVHLSLVLAAGKLAWDAARALGAV